MPGLLNILAICGSTRQQSSNLNIIKAVAGMSNNIFNITIFEELSRLPHFNPDDDLTPESAPEVVQSFRRQLRAADAILICTPEYAIGVPGTLKNAIDWTVSSMEFSQKPVALITAGTSGHKAHQSLLGTLLIIESKITSDTQLVISSVKTKVNANSGITDADTQQQLQNLITSLQQAITAPEDLTSFLPPPSLF